MVTVDAIVTAAERILYEQGTAGLTTNAVAEVAGVSVGSVYQYFSDKHAIVQALQDRYISLFDEVFADALAGARDLVDAAHRLVAGFAMHARRPYAYRSLWQLRTATGAHERFAAQHRWMVDELARALDRFGTASGPDAHALAFVLVHAGDGVANAVANDATADVARIASSFLALVTSLSLSQTKV